MKEQETPGMKTVTVVMPSLLESQSLASLLPSLQSSLAGAGYSPVFLIVNDAARPDQELAEVAQLNNANIVTTPYNMGSQEAILFGLRHALAHYSAQLLLTMDADGQDDPSVAPKLLDAVTDDHVVVSQRTGRRPEPLGFRLCYNLYKTAFFLLTGIRPDFGNYAAFNSRLAQAITRSPHSCITFSMALPLAAPLIRIPTKRLPRSHATSRTGAKGLFVHALRSSLPHLDTIAMRLTAISTIPAFLGFLLLVVSAFLRIFIPELAFPNWATTIAFGVVTMSLQLFTICLILFLSASISRQLFASSSFTQGSRQ